MTGFRLFKCSCVPVFGDSSDKCKRFLIGNLDTKPQNERNLYSLAYPSLSKLRLCKAHASHGYVYEWGDGVSLFTEPAEGNTQDEQTYIQWRASVEMDLVARLTRKRKTTIYLLPIGTIPRSVLEFSLRISNIDKPLLGILQAFAETYFLGLQVAVLPAVQIADKGWSIAQRTSKLTGQPQLRVRDFFPFLRKALPSDGACIMGLSWLDLYPCDKLNFVLGESSTIHHSGVFCFGHFDRLRTENTNNCDTVDAALLWQLLKTFSHEVCHLLRLQHCRFFHCTMNESHTVQEAMDQPLFLCPVCLRKVQKTCGFGLRDRYTSMLGFLQSLHQQCPYYKFQQSVHWLTKCLDFLENSAPPD